MKRNLFLSQARGPALRKSFLFVAGFAAIGVIVLAYALAASDKVPVETESGTLAGPAKLVADPGASGGSAVQFGPVTAPTNLQAFTGGNSIALVWDAPQTAFTNVEVYRNGALLATVTPNPSSALENARLAREYDDASVAAGTTYQYKVRANGSAGASAFSVTVSAAQPSSSAAVPAITIDSSQATDLAPLLTNTVKPLLQTWYPKVANKIAFPSYTPPAGFSIVMDTNAQGGGCTTGNAIIHCVPQFIRDNTGATGNLAALMVHESTHVIQNGYPSDTTGWATEGVASWASDFYARQHINTYTPLTTDQLGVGSYNPAAFFIAYMNATYDPDFARKLNIAQHAGTYTSNFIPSETGGKTQDQAWQELVSKYNSAIGQITGIAGKCLEDQGAVVALFNPLHINSCVSTQTRQKWALHFTDPSKILPFSIINPDLGGGAYCADVTNSGTADGTAVNFFTCNGTSAQQWSHGSGGTLVNVNSTKCLSTLNGGSANGTTMVIRTCDGGADQKWVTP
jgi:hypothetical protein